MQSLSVIKGCIAAYAFGVLFSWASYLWSCHQGTLHVLGPRSSLEISIFYGAIFALPIMVFALLLRLLLARRGTTVDHPWR